MPKSLTRLVAIAALACFTCARADTVASVVAVEQPVWIQIGDFRTELNRSNDIGIDDRVSTSAGGRVEIQLWSDVRLRLYPGSDIVSRRQTGVETGAEAASPELFVERGRLCLRTGPPTSSGRNFRVNVAGALLVTIHQSAHLCVIRSEGMSILGLIDGSVQLSNRIEPGIVVLSEPGIEFHLTDDGDYRLLPPELTTTLAKLDRQPFIVESDSASAGAGKVQAPRVDEKAEAPTAEIEAPAGSEQGGPVYTVYLFSTRSEKIALEVNQRFQNAGHDSRIIVNNQEATTRYRIAVTGFGSYQLAREYSDSVVGTLGIGDTWIGLDKP